MLSDFEMVNNAREAENDDSVLIASAELVPKAGITTTLGAFATRLCLYS